MKLIIINDYYLFFFTKACLVSSSSTLFNLARLKCPSLCALCMCIIYFLDFSIHAATNWHGGVVTTLIPPIFSVFDCLFFVELYDNHHILHLSCWHFVLHQFRRCFDNRLFTRNVLGSCSDDAEVFVSGEFNLRSVYPLAQQAQKIKCLPRCIWMGYCF